MPDEDGRHHTALESRDHHDGVHHRGQGEDDTGVGLVHEVQGDAFPVHEWSCLLVF